MEVGVRFPFSISNGSVNVVASDGEIMKSRLMLCLGTQVTERVMRPQYGIDILGTVYSVGGDYRDAIPEAIADSFRRWFPSLQLLETSIEQVEESGDYYTANVLTVGSVTSYLIVTVRFGRIDSETDEIIRYQLPVSDLAGE